MNIIELFENLNIDKSSLLQITSEEIIRIEKHINVEKKINPDIDVNVANNLIEALKNYPSEFKFIVESRVLYNFFSKKIFFRDSFPLEKIAISEDRVKFFIDKYLQDDLNVFFDKKLTENKYDEMNDILEFKNYFPEEMLFRIAKRAEGKLDYVLSSLHSRNTNYFPILYITKAYFYTFLSHFVSTDIDDKVHILLNEIVDIYNVNKSSQFAEGIMISMANYHPYDEELMDTIASNKRIIQNNIEGRQNKSEKSGFSWKTFLVIILILFKVAIFSDKCSSDSDSVQDIYNNTTYDNTAIEEEPPKLHRYYSESQALIDTFHVFLTDYNKKIMNNLTYNDSIKTGQNPYNNLYKERLDFDATNYIKFTNNTQYDIVMFENVVAHDTINMPKQAYFIKSKQSFKLDTRYQFKRSLNFYIGKRLASFHNIEEKLYIHGNSIVEPRFTILADNASEILKKDYFFENDVIISEKNGRISIDSND